MLEMRFHTAVKGNSIAATLAAPSCWIQAKDVTKGHQATIWLTKDQGRQIRDTLDKWLGDKPATPDVNAALLGQMVLLRDWLKATSDAIYGTQPDFASSITQAAERANKAIVEATA